MTKVEEGRLTGVLVVVMPARQQRPRSDQVIARRHAGEDSVGQRPATME